MIGWYSNIASSTQECNFEQAREVIGPKRLPLLGSYLQYRKGLFPFLMECAQYGDVVPFTIFNKKYYFIKHPELIEQVLVQQAENFPKGWKLGTLKVALGNGLLTSDGEHWRQQRKHMQPAFRLEQITANTKIIVSRIHERIDLWQDGQQLDLYAEMMSLTLDIVCQTLFGMQNPLPESLVTRYSMEWMRRFEKIIINPFMALWPTPSKIRNMRDRQSLFALLQRMIDYHRENPCSRTDVIGWLLNLQAQNPQLLSDRHMKYQLMTLLFTGHETVATVLSLCIFLVSQNRQVLQKLQKELHSVLRGRLPEATDVNKLFFTRQIIMETMRLYPPAWFLLRKARSKSLIGGYSIPAHSDVILASYITQRDARFFAKPNCFWPERWDLEHGEKHPLGAYFPFGLGPRSCIGRNMAMYEATLALAVIMQQHEFSMASDDPPEIQFSFTARPRHRILSRVHLNKSATA